MSVREFARVLLGVCSITLCFGAVGLAADRPNVVLIMTDNHGAWTLGCYGNPDIRTPNIDRLADEGTLFTRAFASNPVCSPTRATFLTGLMPSQHGVHCFLTGGRLQVGPDARCTLDQITSLPEVLRDSGYACGLVGKWHLGDNLHPQEGFDDYWITMPHGGTSTFYDAQIIEDGRIRKEPEYLTDFWTKHAVRFIEQRAESDQPFFLFLAYNGPYSLSRLLLREGQNRHAAYYADKSLDSFPNEPTHPWQFSNRDYHNNPVSIRRVATEVSGIDDGVGTLMQTLKQSGLDENTIVVFVADQGWVGGHGGFFGMGDHTRPVTARDGMMRIPMIWRHPGGIRSGATSDRSVTNYDFMPTLLSYLGLADKMPKQPLSPGQDFTAELTSTKPSKSAEDEWPVFYEFEGLRCIRTTDWKYIHRHPNGPHELYDLRNDPDEFNNLVHRTGHATRVSQLKGQLDAFFDEYAVEEYDMWNGGGSQTRVFVGVDEEVAQGEAVDPPPQPNDFQPTKFKLPDGFTAELAAGPPLVTHPTMGCFDDRGRLFVCNNAGVNLSAEELEETLPNSIRLLEDVDGDGRFDKSTVFADKMTYPMGGAWHDGALYVASPPYIWRLEDTDGDNVADVREPIVKEFGYTGNAASIHGCFFGPDGRLYWCDGYHGHEFKDDDGRVTSKREGSYLFSCRTDGSDVRIHCGGGMDNPVEVDFSENGDLIGSVNILYSRPRVDALVHWLYGGAYPHRERVLQELSVTGDLLGPVHRFGHVAVSGMTRYRSGVMDHRWLDDVFVTFFNSGKVVRVQLESDGATYRATQREFLAGESRDFHPTDVIEDADGSLLVVDTGGWFYRGCPTSQMSKPDILGGIYRIRRDGMTTQVDPWGKRIDWDALSDAQVIKHLNETRSKVRARAIDECVKRSESIVPALAKSMRGDIRVRRNALWALTRIVGDEPSNSQARKAIRAALQDRDPGIRQVACRSMATYPDSDGIDELIGMLTDEEPHVRREAAKALGRLGDVKAIPALINALAHDRRIDRSEEHAIVYALIEINEPDSLKTQLTHDSARVRRVCLTVLDQSDQANLQLGDVAALLDTDDAQLRTAAVKSLVRRANKIEDGKFLTPAESQAIREIADRLRQWSAGQSLSERQRDLIVELTAAYAGTDPIANRIGKTLANSDSPGRRGLALDALSRSNGLGLPAAWREPLTDLLGADDPHLVRQTIDAVVALDADAFRDQLLAMSGKPELPGSLQIAALAALERGNSMLGEQAAERLLELLGSGVPEDATAAARVLSNKRLSSPQLIKLASLLTEAGPTVLRDLIRPFGRSSKIEVGQAFLESLESARSLEQLPTNEVSDIVKRFPAELLPRANKLLDRMKMMDQERVGKLDRLLPLVKTADASEGRAVFFSEKSKCSTCHRVGDRGGMIGPDLTTIGANRSHQDLLESIVFPSASIVRQYETFTVLTKDGQVYAGMVTRYGTDAITLQQQTGDPVEISRDTIDVLAPNAVSIMPTGFDATLSEKEIADMVAWLKTLGSE